MRTPKEHTPEQSGPDEASISSASPRGQAPRIYTAKKPTKRITEIYLSNAGAYYLQRYSASSAHFRSVMMRKIQKSCREYPDQTIEECKQILERVIEKFTSLGYLDDSSYVRSKVLSLRSRGLSERAIQAKLASHAIPDDAVRAALTCYSTDHGLTDEEAEMQAAIKLARKKKIGPFAVYATPESREKSMATLARAGFSYDIARKVVCMPAADVNIH